MYRSFTPSNVTHAGTSRRYNCSSFKATRTLTTPILPGQFMASPNKTSMVSGIWVACTPLSSKCFVMAEWLQDVFSSYGMHVETSENSKFSLYANSTNRSLTKKYKSSVIRISEGFSYVVRDLSSVSLSP